MPNEQQQVQTEPQQQQQQTNEGQQDQNQDILSRVNMLSPEPDQQHDPSSPAVKPEEVGFDRKQHDELVSRLPENIRKQVEDYEKSLFSGVNRKFQDIAQERRQLDELKKQLESSTNQPWTPERVRQLLNDPSFVQSAQTVSSTPNQSGGKLTDEQWSYLSPQEQQALAQQQNMINVLANEVGSMRTQQEDTRLKERYANYDPNAVTKLQTDLLQGKYQATREDIFKVWDYENAIKRAYNLGLKDRQLNINEKRGASSELGGINPTTAYEPPKKEQNESMIDYFRRIATRRMEMSGKK